MSEQANAHNPQTDEPLTEIEGCINLPQLFRKRCHELGPRVALREKEFGIWHSFDWDTFYLRAREIGAGLMALDMQPGDVVSILAENRKEWLYVDLGTMCSQFW